MSFYVKREETAYLVTSDLIRDSLQLANSRELCFQLASKINVSLRGESSRYRQTNEGWLMQRYTYLT